MSFRKRNVPLSKASAGAEPAAEAVRIPQGLRPSPFDGRLTTSTGTATLDDLLGGHAGLPMGHSLLIEETGSTDFATTLLRYYAAEGLAKGHVVHVLGQSSAWGRELPGLVAQGAPQRKHVAKEPLLQQGPGDKMKIAWRYERLGEFGTNARAPPQLATSSAQTHPYSFDLSRRLDPSLVSQIRYHALSIAALESLASVLSSTADKVHRIIVPALISPMSALSTDPTIMLPFLNRLRYLLRAHTNTATAMLSIPLALEPAGPLLRWIEYILDGVVQILPFDSSSPEYDHLATDVHSAGAKAEGGNDGKNPRGLVKLLKIPVVTERGQGITGGDLAFKVGRLGLRIEPWYLRPVDADTDADGGISASSGGDGHNVKAGKVSADQLEF